MKKTVLFVSLAISVAILGTGITLLVLHEGKAETQEETTLSNEENPAETTGSTTPTALSNETVSINITESSPPVSEPFSANATTDVYSVRDTEAP